MASISSLQPVTVPILVGVTGKRKVRLDELGVSEDLVRGKLRSAFSLLQELAPSSPKILLCGMADGVDEIAARLVIEAVDEHNPGRREFRDWSIVGLLPMPEEAFLDDFGPDAGWWYRKLPEEQQNLIRLMPLQTLALPLAPSGGSSASSPCTVEDLRRSQGQSNPARTAHYEQLGMVLAERSTVLIAVMPEGERPDRPGGTAQVVAHRLNGWRPDWPPALSSDVAARSSEIVPPAPLATPVANDVWLVPIAGSGRKANAIDLRILRRRAENEPAWPAPPPSPRRAMPLSWWQADPDMLIRSGHRYRKRAWSSCPLLRPIDAFNRRAASIEARPVPDWDDTIDAFHGEPAQWSPVAATERLRGTLSDIQRDRKSRVGKTATWLALIAGVSIFLLELYAELFDKEWATPLQVVPFAYAALVVLAIRLYVRAARRAWPAIAEDYRLVAEALRVQLNWWRIGLTARRDRVDNFILRYDTGAFQLLRRGLATLLDGVGFLHDKIPTAPTDRLPALVTQWIDNADRGPPGQIQYHDGTAEDRKRRFGWAEFWAWSLFGLSLGAAFWLAVYTAVRLAAHQLEEVSGYVGQVKDWFVHDPQAWIVPAVAAGVGLALLFLLGKEDLRSPELAFKAPHIFGSWLAAIFLGAAVSALWLKFGCAPDGLRKLLFLGSVILLAWGGIFRYRTEKIAIEAEAQGSEMALPIYRRAKAALEEVDKYCADPEAARRRREKIIRDLGKFALTETEAWLRSHRERPLHPALG